MNGCYVESAVVDGKKIWIVKDPVTQATITQGDTPSAAVRLYEEMKERAGDKSCSDTY